MADSLPQLLKAGYLSVSGSASTIARRSKCVGNLGFRGTGPAVIHALKGCGFRQKSSLCFPGDDDSCSLDAVRIDANGVVSVAADVVPGLFHDMNRNASSSNWQIAVENDHRLRHFYGILALATKPIPVKWAIYTKRLIDKGI